MATLVAALLTPGLIVFSQEDDTTPSTETVNSVVTLVGRVDRPLELGRKLEGSLLLETLGGQRVRFDRLRGRIVVFVFWSTRCPYSQRYEPKLNRFALDYARHGVLLVAVNANFPEIGAETLNLAGLAPRAIEASYRARYPKLTEHRRKAKLLFPIVIDSGNRLADEVDAKWTPEAFVFDRAGRFRYAGAIDDDPRNERPDERQTYLRDAVHAILAGEEVATPRTRALGCTIKRVPEARGK
ncbi:MAG: redoxin domain-containing protein [Planctomycetota bacterium]